MVMDLEMEIEDLRREHKEEINNNSNRMEDQIKEIRIYYENQKDDYERRVKEEKDKQNKKYF